MARYIGQCKESVLGLHGSILAMLLICFAIGYFSERGLPGVGGIMVCLLVANYIHFCRLADIQFGRQGLLPKQIYCHLCISIVVWLAYIVSWGIAFQMMSTGSGWVKSMWKLGYQLFTVAPAVVAYMTGARSFPIVGSIACLMHGLAPVLLFDAQEAHDIWEGPISALALLPVGFAKYRNQECFLAFMPIVMATSIHSGEKFGEDMLEPLWIMLSVLGAYLQMLWVRRRRDLPPTLEGCKFITLKYFRQIAASGEGIRRCQELPPEAFGDPSKAKYLIVISHRWMDRFTCDVKTAENPEGLRLRMVLDHLNEVFSTAGLLKGIWETKGLLGKLQRFRYAMTGGSDVLVFFDFMSLPQVGRMEDGTIIPRTDEEEELFQRCLPSMGILYSMFPVVVSPEVTGTSESFLSSGWCYSESCTAWLGDQLGLFPSNNELRLRLDEQIPHVEDLPTVGLKLDRSLRKKTFLYDGDRFIARTMIGGFVLKWRLVNALQQKLALELDSVLRELAEGGFECIVNQPVDASLNTPLHYAVAVNFCVGVQLLLDAGADKYARNIYGDSPVQFFLFPRLREAARLCRRLPTNALAVEQCQDSFSKYACQFTFSLDTGSNSINSFIDSVVTYHPDPMLAESSTCDDNCVLHVAAPDVPSKVCPIIVSLDDDPDVDNATNSDNDNLTDVPFSEDSTNDGTSVSPCSCIERL